MMGRRIAGFAAAAALLGSVAAPAEAQWRGGYRHHRGGGDTVGNLLLGGLIGGVLVAAASSSRKKKVETVAEPVPGDLPPPPIAPPGAYPAVGSADLEREAVDTCTAAAENGARASVDRISHVAREGDAWRVDGELGEGGAYGRVVGRFTCATAEGRVLEFRLDDGRVAGAPRRGPAT